jgi:DNA-binding NarL/FixJ family response regulator
MTRVLIATNEPIRAKGLETILIAGGLDVACVCQDVFELFESVPRCRPDIVVFDIPGFAAPEVIQDLRRLAPKCQFVPWPRLGPDESPGRLIDALQTMARCSEISPTPSSLVNSTCTDRERELISLVGYGLNNEEIAAATGYDRPSVRKLLRSLSDRLGVEDRCELVLYGLSTLKEQQQDEWSQ